MLMQVAAFLEFAFWFIFSDKGQMNGKMSVVVYNLSKIDAAGTINIRAIS